MRSFERIIYQTVKKQKSIAELNEKNIQRLTRELELHKEALEA